MVWPNPGPAPAGESAVQTVRNRLVTDAELNGPDWIDPAADITATPAADLTASSRLDQRDPPGIGPSHLHGQRHARHDRQAFLQRLDYPGVAAGNAGFPAAPGGGAGWSAGPDVQRPANVSL